MCTLTRGLFLSVVAMALAGCTVKDVDVPALAGPSSVAYSIELTPSSNTVTQDGVSQVRISIVARDIHGQPMNGRPLRAEIVVDGVAQDFGALNTKNPVTGSTLIYTAPPPSPVATRTQVVTIGVTPLDSGVFGNEFRRDVEIILVPQGVILPSNPNLAPSFTFTPALPQVMAVVTFNASGTTNNGTACGTACTYAWDFGDGTTANGQAVTHQFRTVGNFLVRLTVTDHRGAQATAVQTIVIAAGTPPGAQFTTSPTNPAVNQTVFFNASQSTPAPGRTIVSYDWSFGDGTFGQGAITTHAYDASGVYRVQLTTTDDAGSIGRSAVLDLTVGTPSGGPEPVAALTCSVPVGTRRASCDASASRPGSASNIVSYTFNWGDGSPDEVVTSPLQTHTYTGPGTFVITLTVRDSQGRTDTAQVTVTVS